MTRSDVRVTFYSLAAEALRAFSRTYPNTRLFSIGALEWGPTATWPPRTFLSRRAYGQCSWDAEARKATIRIAPKATRASPQLVRGVLMHELGHAVLFARGGLGHRRDDRQDTAAQRHAAECAADAEAERLFESRIYYDPELLVQLDAPAGIRPRPMELDEMLTRATAELPALRGNPRGVYTCGCAD